MRRLGAVLILIATVVAGAGCGGKNPAKPPTGTPAPSYPLRSTPESALLYYVLAWTRRDSTRIDSVLAPGYVGTSFDAGDPMGDTLRFDKQDEIHIAHVMAESPQISAIFVDMHPQATWTRTSYVGDPPERVAIQVNHPSVTVLLAGGVELLAGDSDFMEFKFDPTTPAPSSPTDTLWTMVQWTEHRSLY